MVAKKTSRRAPPAPSSKPRAAPRRSPSIGDWRDRTLPELRAVIMRADPHAIEEVKWRKPSNPDGVPVWSHDGIVCIGNTLKASVRLTFPKGAQIADPRHLFNSRMDSRSVRAIDVHEGEIIDESALAAIVAAAVELNRSRARDR